MSPVLSARALRKWQASVKSVTHLYFPYVGFHVPVRTRRIARLRSSITLTHRSYSLSLMPLANVRASSAVPPAAGMQGSAGGRRPVREAFLGHSTADFTTSRAAVPRPRTTSPGWTLGRPPVMFSTLNSTPTSCLPSRCSILRVSSVVQRISNGRSVDVDGGPGIGVLRLAETRDERSVASKFLQYGVEW